MVENAAIGDKHGLLKWIGEKLNELCGFKEANVSQFVLSIAQKHAEASSTSSHKKVFETLKDSGFDAVTLEFSRELCNRLLQQQQTKGAKREKEEKKKTSTKIATAAYIDDEDEESKYALVKSSSSDDDEEHLKKKTSKKSLKKKKMKRKKKKRKQSR